MMIVQAPYPAPQTTLLLPSAEQANYRSLASTVQTIRANDGTLYTYIKGKRARKENQWDVECQRNKFLETKEFIRRYNSKLVQVVDHNGDLRVGYLTMNPLDGEGQGGCPEYYRFTVILEEKV